MPTFVLIDFENVQPAELQRLAAGDFAVKVFVGAKQSKIPVAVAMAVHALGTAAEYVQIEGTGRNALDFHLAFEIGRLVTCESRIRLRVISKDAGYDPLLKHLAASGHDCRRVVSVTELVAPDKPKKGGSGDRSKSPPTAAARPTVRSSKTNDDEDLLARLAIIDRRLRAADERCRPGRRATLVNAIRSWLGVGHDEPACEVLVEQLVLRRIVAFDGDRAVYSLQAGAATT